jgi:hypothetical protein
MSNFSNKLKKFEKTFKTAKKRAHEEGFGNELPDGKYKTMLESCTLAEAQSSGKLQVIFAFVITAGELKGEKVRKYACVETEDDQVWFARDLKRFGIEAPETADDLEEVVKLLDGAKPELTISIKTKDSGQFTYIDKVHSDIEAGDLSKKDSDDEEEDDKEDEDEDEEDIEAEENEDSEEKEDTDTAVEIGMEVVFKSESGKVRKGKVIKILEKEESVKVKTEKGNTYTVKLEDISIPEIEEDDEEQEEVEVKKSKQSNVKKHKK